MVQNRFLDSAELHYGFGKGSASSKSYPNRNNGAQSAPEHYIFTFFHPRVTWFPTIVAQQVCEIQGWDKYIRWGTAGYLGTSGRSCRDPRRCGELESLLDVRENPRLQQSKRQRQTTETSGTKEDELGRWAMEADLTSFRSIVDQEQPGQQVSRGI